MDNGVLLILRECETTKHKTFTFNSYDEMMEFINSDEFKENIIVLNSTKIDRYTYLIVIKYREQNYFERGE